jgi:hypothetical protein
VKQFMEATQMTQRKYSRSIVALAVAGAIALGACSSPDNDNTSTTQGSGGVTTTVADQLTTTTLAELTTTTAAG